MSYILNMIAIKMLRTLAVFHLQFATDGWPSASAWTAALCWLDAARSL